MRISKLEKEKRILKVQHWILDGVPEDLMRKQMKTEWGISTRQAKRYIKDARLAWMVDSETDMETRRQNKIAQLEHRIRSLKPEYKGTPAGLRAQASIEKLIIMLEPYSVRRVDVTTKGKTVGGDMAPRTVIIQECNG
ncbi:hypothetical protein [Gaetbulibacter sp. PBL-D1]|uniref:hypothetical protein n=1 Tax=Gaetbulibacter sp. PBL-D1 TaxID=3422594 RepID=UPI003D2EF382